MPSSRRSSGAGGRRLTGPAWDAVVYCDSSALVRVYLADEAGTPTSPLLLDPRRLVVTSALTEVEIVAAIRARRVQAAIKFRMWPSPRRRRRWGRRPGPLLARSTRRVCFRERERSVQIHRLRALDAVHLAVALTSAAEEMDGEFVFVTRDADQAAAARAEGLSWRRRRLARRPNALGPPGRGPAPIAAALRG